MKIVTSNDEIDVMKLETIETLKKNQEEVMESDIKTYNESRKQIEILHYRHGIND